MRQLARQRYVSATCFLTLYLALGDIPRALEWLDKAYEERSAHLMCVKVDPRYDRLRSNPRLEAVMRNIRLE